MILLKTQEAETMYDWLGIYHKEIWADLNEEIEMLIRIHYGKGKKTDKSKRSHSSGSVKENL